EANEQKNALIEVGGEEFHPEFTRKLEGMRPGEEKSFTIVYGADDPDPRARGKEVVYTVRLNEVKKKVLPALDDEPAKDLGQHETLAELKAALAADLERRKEREKRRAQETELARMLLAEVDYEVPQVLVEHELDGLVEEQARMLAHRGIDVRTAPIDWRATR